MAVERVVLARPVGFGPTVVATPFQFATRDNEHLRVSSWSRGSQEILLLTLRVQTPRGEIKTSQDTHATDVTPFTKRSTLHPLGAGFLLNAGIRLQTGAANMLRGDIYTVVEVVQGFEGAVIPVGTLLQGYVAREASLGWPGSALSHPHEGPGRQLDVGIQTPAAGAEFSASLATGQRWRLVSISWLLATSAVVATRVPRLTIRPNTLVAGVFPSSRTAVASTTTRHSFCAGGPGDGAVAIGTGVGAVPENLFLRGGDSIESDTDSLQAGDQITNVVASVEQWLDP